MQNCPDERIPFAIVCDSSCDLPLSQLERVGVSFVPFSVATPTGSQRDCMELDPVDFFVELTLGHAGTTANAPQQADYQSVLRDLRDAGNQRIVVLTGSSALSGSYHAAVQAAATLPDADIRVLDTKCASAQMAFALAALVRDREAGMDMESAVARCLEVARSSRLMVIPAKGSPASMQGKRGRRTGILGLTDSLGARVMGLHRLFEIDEGGCVRELFRSRDLSQLAGIMARRVSTYSQEVGPITFVEVNAGVPSLLAMIEKPLHTNEFESDRAAIANTNPSTTIMLGVGAVGLAYVPSSLLSAEDAERTMRTFGAAR